jgi:hypothetical protein
MASLAGLGSYIQNLGALQQQAIQQQDQQMRLQQFQQQQAAQRAAQTQQAAAANYLSGLQPPPQAPQQPFASPAPQPPQPGQASQPAQPPQPQGGGVPLPPGLPPGMGQLKPPLPPPGTPLGQPSGPQPYRAMPTTPPQSAAPQGAIPTPPAAVSPDAQVTAQTVASQAPAGGWSLQDAAREIKKQNPDISGADLWGALSLIQPVLDTEAKNRLAAAQTQFNQELQIARVNETIDWHNREAQNQANSLEERTRHAKQEEDLTRQRDTFRQQTITQKLNADKDAVLSGDDLRFMAQQYLAFPDKSIFTNLGRGTQGAKNVVGLREEIMKQAKDQGMGPADLAALQATLSAETAFARAAGTRAAAVAIPAAEFNKLVPLIKKANESYPRGDFPKFNAALNAYETNTGDTNIIVLGQALDTAINVYARAISPTGTPTVTDKEHAHDKLSPIYSAGGINGVLDFMQQETGAALQAPTEVLQQQQQRIAARGKKGAEPAAPTANQPKQIKTDADYDALPSGAEFIAPDGSRRRKP